MKSDSYFNSNSNPFKFYLVLCAVIAVFFASSANAQVTNYSFASSGGSFNALGGTRTILSTGAWDDSPAGISIPLGFTFNYNGSNFTSCNINLNGYITFGTTTGTTNYTPISTVTAGETGAIAGFARDLQG